MFERAKVARESKSRSDNEKRIAALAKLSPLQYAQQRKHAAKELAVTVGMLDKLVSAARAAEPEAPLFPHWQVAPASEPVDAERLLTRLVGRIRSHVVMGDDRARVTALWVVLTWVHDEAAVHSPILLITSPEANSGKTTLLGVLSFLVRRSLRNVGCSAAALYRAVEKWQPTIMVDEADTAFVDNDDLRQVVNSGWTRGEGVLRCDGENNEPYLFPTFCPKAIGMKGRKLPDTTMSRTIVIEMARRKPGERALDFQYLDDDGLAELRSELARYAVDSAEALRRAKPVLPEGFENRCAANWRLLVAIADTGGEEWGRKARAAAEKIAGATTTESAGTELLADIKKVFESEGEPESILSQRLVGLLTADPESRWCEWGRDSKPITQTQLAGLLRDFRIKSATIHGRDGESDAKGYRLASFEEAWARDLPAETLPSDAFPPSEPSGRPDADEMGTSCNFRSVREASPDGSKNDDLSLFHAGSDARTDRNGGNGDACPSDTGSEPSSAPEPEERQISTSPEDRRQPGPRPNGGRDSH
jgi:putative DNA primase/helicase